ncbi:MAG: response regulator [Nitrospirae bacterium]|nr:response regulator [Nitrospirota bacterium]
MQNKVLIIDDDQQSSTTLAGILRQKGGFETATACSAREALTIMRQTNYDAVLIDIVLPDMEGTSLLKELRKINPCVASVIITGHADFDNVYEAISSGADGFFTKPVCVDDVLLRIKESMHQKCLQKQLIESEERYRNLVQKSSEGICNLNMDGRIVFINPACQKMFEKDEEELSGVKYVDVVNPKDIAQVEDAVQCAQKGVNVSLQYEIATYSTNKWVESTITPIKTDRGDVTSILIISRDITGRIDLERRLEATIKEKETLLREIHHRVKNNMQVIISLLKLQAAYLKDSCNMDMFKDCENRIKAMAIVHERLHRTSDMTTINFKYYVKQVANEMMSSYLGVKRRITLKITGEDFILGIDTAVPCGLVINELLSNAIKHAFPNDDNGIIKIHFKSIRTDEYEVTVKDNGVGMPANAAPAASSDTLGLTLVHMLVETQLKGKVYYEVDGGTEFHFTFKEIRHKRLDH